ncbi:uracil-DNA glycosylase family protein [Dyadobacter psychrotolerans]|uniref:Uracil-DNA glycosylase-like domain-containing protein n=1 Tax=Dyadobacter psychrotolerans TaxID=2541721 RepID=A0A4R5DPM0_9BACT|nr:uracil-DNA glycosylase family protein [Dyadobacter psychrotolerans]TDE12915.1 hypothetical protein E0F88_21500 [Dyadobacter psychrotolerans]
MSTATVNQQLKDLYLPYLALTHKKTWDPKTSSPLLMNVPDDYLNMKRKILFVGQETHTWMGDMSKHYNVDELQTCYKNFDLGKNVTFGNSDKPRQLNSPFWNFFRTLFYDLNKEDSSVTPKTSGFLWTNISKFDFNGTTPSKNVQEENAAGFELLKAEIEIVKPDIVIFCTGTKYDDKIKSVFQPTWNNILGGGLLTQLSTTDNSLPELTFQTKHPRTLCMKRENRKVVEELTGILLNTSKV